MDILPTIISDVGKCLYEPMKRHCGYLCCYARNVEKLSAEVTTLSMLKNDVDNKLEEERRTSQKEPLEAVKQWKEDVEKVARQAIVYSGQLSGEQRPIQMGWGCWCLNVITWRYKLGKNAAKEIVKVQTLTNDLNNFHGVLTYSPPPSNIVVRRSDTIQHNESTTSVEGRVMQALGDDKCRSIGIYGMGGIGKTTLVIEINNDMAESNLFDKIIMVTISQNPDLKRIQEQIAGSLGILKHFTEEVKTDQHRASRLFNELKKWKRVLIILDDVWKELDMAAVGISIPSKDEHPCCKIIITTGDKDVCVRMRMDIKISVEPWSKEDSRELFDSKVGQDLILKNPQLEPLANEIIKECGGSPLAILTLASALVGKDNEVIWKDALRSLRSSDPNELENIEGMVDTVIKSIKYSYNNLPGDHEGMNRLDSAKTHPMQLCFLFCSLFPEDYDINLFDLRTYGVGEGFLRVDGSVLYARGRLVSYIERLKARNLILDSSKRNCVKMHDVVRDVARHIASKEHGFVEKARIGLNEWPELHDEEYCKRLSLMKNDIRVLPADNYLNMPELRTLLLTGNRNLRQISDNFFAGMNKLVNLDLSDTAVMSLTPSISCLTSLRTLNALLHTSGAECDMSLVGKLKKLEILILGRQRLIVPNGLGELTNLKVLHLDQKLASIPEAVIPKLILLEELCLDRSSGGRTYSDRSATFAEVASLKHLTTLELGVDTSVGILSQDIPLCWEDNNLQEFIINLGTNCQFPWRRMDFSKILFIKNLSHPIKRWVLFLLQKTEQLYVMQNKDLWYFPCLDKMGNLKRLTINDWAVMKNVANIEEVPQTTNYLGRLERLHLEKLPNLERICQGPLGDGFVMNLKELIVMECDKIQSIMPLNLLQASQSLESLEVERCASLTNVVSINFKALNNIASDQKIQLGDQYSTYSILPRDIGKKKKMLFNEEGGAMVREDSFPKLNKLNLRYLPNLVSFYNFLPDPITHFGKQQEQSLQLGDSSIESNIVGVLLLQNLTMLHVGYCDNLKNLHPLGSLQMLRQLHIKSCNNLTSLFKLSMIKKYGSLRSVQNISVEYSSRLKWIIVKEEDEDGKGDWLSWDHLTHLKLGYLKELMSFYSWDTNILLSPSLKEINVLWCENFQIQSILSVDILETSRLISLKSLRVVRCKSQTQLVSINAEVPSIINSDKAQLGEHSTDRKMKKLSFNKEAVIVERGGSFPVLDKLILDNLPNLMSICLLQPAKAKYFGKQLINQGLDDASIAENDQMPAMQALAPNLAVFLNLTKLNISSCHNLKYLFSLNVFQNGGLQELQEINIFDCNNLKWIIVNEEYIEEGEKNGGEGFVSFGVNKEKGILFPRLKTLKVRYCAELVSCVMTKKRDMDKSDDPLFAAILIWPELMELDLSNLPNLLCLYGEEGFGSFLLQHPPLTRVEIRRCPKLCKHNINSSSLLGNNTLINLSSSQTSSSSAPVVFSLRDLRIFGFDQIEHVFGFEEGISTSLFHKLDKLILQDLPTLESICTGYVPPGSFSSLKYVEVNRCHSLRRCLQFSLIHAGSLQHLESLEVKSCKKLEKLIASPADEEEGDQKTVVELPRLKKLRLDNLPELTSLYEGGDAFLRLPSLEWTNTDSRIMTLVKPFKEEATS